MRSIRFLALVGQFMLAHALSQDPVSIRQEGIVSMTMNDWAPAYTDVPLVANCSGVNLYGNKIASDICEKLQVMRAMKKPYDQCSSNGTVVELNHFLLLRDAVVSGGVVKHIWKQSGCDTCGAFTSINYWYCSNIFLPRTQSMLSEVVNAHSTVCKTTRLFETRCEYGCDGCTLNVAHDMLRTSMWGQIGSFIIYDVESNTNGGPAPEVTRERRKDVQRVLLSIISFMLTDGIFLFLSVTQKEPTSNMRVLQFCATFFGALIQLSSVTTLGVLGTFLLAFAFYGTYHRYGINVGVGAVLFFSLLTKVAACVCVVVATRGADAILYGSILMFLFVMAYQVIVHHSHFDMFMCVTLLYSIISVGLIGRVLDRAGHESDTVNIIVDVLISAVGPTGRFFGTFSGGLIANAAFVASKFEDVSIMNRINPILAQVLLFVFIIVSCTSILLVSRVVCGWAFITHRHKASFWPRAWQAMLIGFSGFEYVSIIFTAFSGSKRDHRIYFAVLMTTSLVCCSFFAWDLLLVAFALFIYRFVWLGNNGFVSSSFAVDEWVAVSANRATFESSASTLPISFKDVMDMFTASTVVQVWKASEAVVYGSCMVCDSAGKLMVKSIGHVFECGTKYQVNVKYYPFEEGIAKTFTYNPTDYINEIHCDSVITLYGEYSYGGRVFKELAYNERVKVESIIVVKPKTREFDLLDKNKFEFTLELIKLHVNLNFGDSGSPLFGVLDDGDIRYCGAIVAGTVGQGPNVGVPVYYKPDAKFDSAIGVGQSNYEAHQPSKVQGRSTLDLKVAEQCIGWLENNLEVQSTTPGEAFRIAEGNEKLKGFYAANYLSSNAPSIEVMKIAFKNGSLTREQLREAFDQPVRGAPFNNPDVANVFPADKPLRMPDSIIDMPALAPGSRAGLGHGKLDRRREEALVAPQPTSSGRLRFQKAFKKSTLPEDNRGGAGPSSHMVPINEEVPAGKEDDTPDVL